MEPFRLTRQTIASISLVCAIAVIVAIAAPFGSIALGGAGLLTLATVLVKALLRGRNWRPLTAVEGTLALSSAILVLASVAVIAYAIARIGTEHLHMMIGWPHFAQPREQIGQRSVHYGDPDLQQRVKDALGDAGIPFSTRTRDRQEFITWSPEHNAAAQAVIDRVQEPRLPDRRNVHFPDPAQQKEFTDWLTGNGIGTRS
jgi:hypothetical protein